MSIDVENISLYGYGDPEETISLATYGYLSGTALPAIIDYCVEAKSRLAEQFKNSYDLQGLVCALLSEIQELEVVFSDLMINRALDTAVGAQLEGIAEIVGADISGMTTQEARNAIRAQIALNVSNGEPEFVINFVKEVTDADHIIYSELYPAKIHIFTDGQTIPSNLITLIKSVIPAGVGIEVVCSFGDDMPFAFAPEGGIPDPNGLGFGETTYPDEGGVISEKIT